MMNKKFIWIPIVILVIMVFVFVLHVIIENSNNYLKENLFSEISYKIPSKFECDEDYTYSRYYNYKENSVYCSFSVHVSEKDYYDDINNWFKENIRISLNDKVSELKEVNINNNKMLYIEKRSKGSLDYYYGLETSKYFYQLTYSIDDYENGDRNDLDSNYCYNAKDRIISSVNIK